MELSWHGIAFGILCLFLGYGAGSGITRAQMRAERSNEREEEWETFKAERQKWIDHGRAVERQIREANENSN